MDVKKLIDSLIIDLANNNDIVAISRKAQVIANLLENEYFYDWVNKEFVEGYEHSSDLPSHRKFQALEVKCTYITGNAIAGAKASNVILPIANLGEKKFHQIMDIKVYDTISVIKQLIPDNDNVYTSLSPLEILYIQEGILPMHQILSIHKVLSRQNYINLVETSLSGLLKMLLEMNKKIFNNKIDFDIMATSDRNNIINNIISNANVVNVGNGSIKFDNSKIIGGNSTVSISDEVSSRISELLEQIESLEKRLDEDEEDMAQYILEIQQQLDSERPNAAIIKRALRALKTLKTIAIEKAIELGIDQIIPLL